MKRILLVCHLDNSKTSGQEAKTLDVVQKLRDHNFEVDIFNYGKMNFFQKLFKFLKKIKIADFIILMPGGRKALSFYCLLLSICAKEKDIHYLVVGGWVVDYYLNNKNKKTFKFLRKIKGIYLQNDESVSFFKKQGFENCFCVPTFSSKKTLSNKEFEDSLLMIKSQEEFKFCYFARISENKGILLACESIIELCLKYPKLHISLDIYGEFQDQKIQERVTNIINSHKCINYLGILSGDNTIKKLSVYYALLFPTFYPGEGTPHTIIESFMAGVPVIASDWKFNKFIIDNQKTGLIFDLKTPHDLTNRIESLLNDKNKEIKMRKNSYEESKKYLPDVALRAFFDNL